MLSVLTVVYDSWLSVTMNKVKPNLFPGERLQPNDISSSKSDSSSNPKAQNQPSADSKPFPDERTVGSLM